MSRLSIFALGLVLAAFFEPSCADDGPEQLELLRKNGIATETDAILTYLGRFLPDPQRETEIVRLVEQLADRDFAKREAATKALPAFGDAARELVSEAAQSSKLEIRRRAIKILEQLDVESQRRQLLLPAALQVLQSRRASKAVPFLLAVLTVRVDPYARGEAAEALWASVTASHVELLMGALNHEHVELRAAAIVALEVAGGEDVVERIAPLLASDKAVIRLAAARALIDREPKRVVEILVKLAGDEDADVAWQADALLQMKTGYEVEFNGGQSLGDAWRKWFAEHISTARLETPLGVRRLDLSAGRGVLEERFARDAKSLDEGYGRFLYEADNGGTAKVADGRLHIEGNNPEGDQRFYITSQRMIGRDRWPDQLEVRAKVAGEEGNNFGWHLGVSVGRVKTLFHPGQSRGYFRAETTDEHRYLFQNENMSFEPAVNVTHEMIIRVKRTAAGAEFDVTVIDGKGGEPYQKQFEVTHEQLGDFNRIGLERSGRTGGAAQFDSVSIRLSPAKSEPVELPAGDRPAE